MAFDDAGAVGEGEAGSDGVEVLAREAREAAYRLGCVLPGLADPVHEQVAAPVGDQVVESAGEVAGAGDVRAGGADLEELFLLALGQRLARAHDPAGDPVWAGDVGADRLGVARAQGGEVFAVDLAAAPVATGLEFEEQPAAADLASCFGEAVVEVCLERFQHARRAPVVGGGQQLVGAGVAEAAHGLAVQVQAAGDRAEGPACVQEAVDVLVAVPGPLGHLGAGQFEGRQLGQWRLRPELPGLAFGTFAQAVAVLVTGFLHGGGQVLEQVKSVCNLGCVGRRLADGAAVAAVAVPAHDLRAGVGSQPGCQGFAVPVRQQVDHCGGLHVQHDGPVGPRAPEGEVVHAQHPRADATGELVEEGSDGFGGRPPTFKSAASGLVSTAEDCLAFASALLANGTHRGERVLSRPSVSLMTSDHLTPIQKAVSRWFWPLGHFADFGWGFGMEVRTRRTNLGPSVGSYGWYGKYGTAWSNDPAEDMTTIFMIQRAEGLELPALVDFWTAAYQAIDD